jgi:hypothetical protein
MMDFDPSKNHICCYAHIINICSSHIIASVTSATSKALDDFSNDLDECDVDPDPDPNHIIDELALPSCYNDRGSPNLRWWFMSIKCNPLKHAQRLVCFLCSSDLHKQGLQDFITLRNEQKWFMTMDKDGNPILDIVPHLELLRDVKTRWDSVYMMLQHLW